MKVVFMEIEKQLDNMLVYVMKMQKTLKTELKPEVESVKRLKRFNDAMFQMYQDGEVELH